MTASTPFAALAAWLITRWQIERDITCAQDAAHASCGLTAGDAAWLVAASGLVAALVALVVGWWGGRSGHARVGWSVVVAWVVLVAVYLALPPSG